MNPFDMIKNYMTSGLTPKGIVMNITKSNPFFNNLVDMAEKGDNKGIETFARNYFKGRGLDYDQVMTNFKNKLNLH